MTLFQLDEAFSIWDRRVSLTPYFKPLFTIPYFETSSSQTSTTTDSVTRGRNVHVARWTNSLARYVRPNKLSAWHIQCPDPLPCPQIFSGESSPFAPAELLLTTWRTSSELAGYAQQDAHECFMAMLNQIHTSSRGSTNISCNCIIHSTFQGFLQSDVKCERCGNVTTAVDPMLDISLELRGKGGAGTSGEENSLTACLQR